MPLILNINLYEKHLMLALILSVCVIVPLTNDIFISGTAEMSRYFPGQSISLVLSFSLLGLACSQIFYGPCSDRYGRKPVLLTGLSLFTLMSLIITFTSSFKLLLIGRFIQAIGACSAIVNALAIARDSFSKQELVKATSLIMAILGAGPALAPLLGSFLNDFWGWRASFAFLSLLGFAYTLFIYFYFEETHPQENLRALSLKPLIKNYCALAANKNFLIYCLTSGFSYGVLFCYIALSSFFLIEQLKYSLLQFGFIVAFNALAIILMAIVTPKIMHRISLNRTMLNGTIIISSGGFLLWMLNTVFNLSIYTFMLPIFIITLGIGMIRPTASAGAMSQVDSHNAGSASAFFNFFSFVGGSAATAYVSPNIHQASHFGLFIGFMGLCAFTLIKVAKYAEHHE